MKNSLQLITDTAYSLNFFYFIFQNIFLNQNNNKDDCKMIL
ncbi:MULTISPECIES: hypothetical protein [Bacillaceae]|nr:MULTISPECIES: hypothetical protein [Bacillaceae]